MSRKVILKLYKKLSGFLGVAINPGGDSHMWVIRDNERYAVGWVPILDQDYKRLTLDEFIEAYRLEML